MTYAFVQYLPGVSSEGYARVVAALGSQPYGGLLAHLAGPCDGGWRIIQAWRSADDYAQFERSRLWDAVIASGIMSSASPPYVEMLDVRHLIVERSEVVHLHEPANEASQ